MKSHFPLPPTSPSCGALKQDLGISVCTNHTFQVQGLILSSCAPAESFCLPGVHPALTLQSRGCGCPSRYFPLGPGRTPLEVVTPSRSQVRPALPRPGWAVVIAVQSCCFHALDPPTLERHLPHPHMPSRNCRYYVSSTLQGACFFHSKRKTTFLIYFMCTKSIRRKASLELTGHSFLDFGILLKNASGTDHCILWNL